MGGFDTSKDYSYLDKSKNKKPVNKKPTVSKKSASKKKNTEEDDAEFESDDPGYRVHVKSFMLTWSQDGYPDDYYDILKQSFTDGSEPNIAHWTLTKETCKDGKFHYHAYIIGKKAFDRQLKSFVFGGISANHISVNRARGTQATCKAAQGAYYVFCPKIGTVCSDISSEDLHNLIRTHIKTKWVFDWLRQRKLTLETVKSECDKYLIWTVPSRRDYELLVRDEKSAYMLSLCQSRRTIISDSLRPFHSYDVIDEWKDTFSEILSRYLFLVLYGSSQLGKTELAISLFKNPFVHCNKIMWNGYDPRIHDAIIFDDIPNIWNIVVKEKGVFISDSFLHVCNESTTMMYAQQFTTAGKPIIICTNDNYRDAWNDELDETAPSKCAWISKNSKFFSLSNPTAVAKIGDKPICWNCEVDSNGDYFAYKPAEAECPENPEATSDTEKGTLTL